MSTISVADYLNSLNACGPFIKWARDYSTIQEAWADCPRGDWLLWYATKIGVGQKFLVRAACLCVREALIHVPAGEDRPRLAIEAAETWCRGEATLKEVEKARAAAYAAAHAATADAAYAAAHAAYAADYTAVAYFAANTADAAEFADAAIAAAASAAAYAVNPAAYNAAGSVAFTASLARSADLVRSVIPSVG